ncbi:MAG: Lrp/AsnC family transcriptional regulator [Deltaproteobacteria bacterium]|nr:Lrp/AsnC family transcriptional regulator [Deltaproteobacteria bacterium]MBW2593097.1 Lrp/AsnC family transcriptional regulator [Deltaproteobacteria bacterium]
MKIDDLNIAIIKHLIDGRKAYKLIATDLNVSENTIRARVNKMREAGILEIAGLVDPSAIPGHSTVIIGVKLKTTDLVQKGNEFSELKGVVSVAVVTGRYDLMLMAVFKEGFGLLEFYTEEISRIEGVQSLETFVIYKSYNLKVPYKL